MRVWLSAYFYRIAGKIRGAPSAIETEAGQLRQESQRLLRENESLSRENTQLKDENSIHQDWVAAAEKTKDEATAETRDTRREITALKRENSRLRKILEKEYGDIPLSFADLESWSKKHLGNKVILHPRALKAAKKSEFEDVPLAYRALRVLRDYYVPMRREGGMHLKNAYDAALRELKLEQSPSISNTRAGEEGSDYTVRFQDRNRKLDCHLKGRNSTDPRLCFRLYFFWHDAGKQVVVGYLPGHLGIRGS